MHISIFWGQEHLTNRSISKALPQKRYRYMSRKKFQLQEQYTLVTQDSICHLKTLCMSVLSLVLALESEWKCNSSSQSDKKTLAFEYEFSLRVFWNKLQLILASTNFLTSHYPDNSILTLAMESILQAFAILSDVILVVRVVNLTHVILTVLPWQWRRCCECLPYSVT